MNDTIAAIATPPITAAIGIIRISGSESKNIFEKIFNCNADKIKSRYMYVKKAIDPQNKNILDECCCIFFKGPQSYTGQDMVEIYCHGSVFICQAILNAIISLKNCRLARNGEFTQQAYTNGKINLTKAESILDIINSNSKKSHEIALSQYKGSIYQKITNTREILMENLLKIEASLEFPDDVGTIQVDEIKKSLNTLIYDLNKIIKNSDYGMKIKEGIRYLIIGKPNVGKSSLMNCITGENRSIVSTIAGTTRDYIDISVEYKGVVITFIDTAGIRSTTNDIENQGIEKISDLANNVDGYIHVHDANESYDKSIPDILNPEKPIINVINKVDMIKNQIKDSKAILTSCKTKEGISTLKDQLVKEFINIESFESDLILCNLRQISSLKEANQYITNANKQLENNETLDVVSIEIRDAINQLNNILGKDFTEELLDGIFSKFCIGK